MRLKHWQFDEIVMLFPSLMMVVGVLALSVIAADPVIATAVTVAAASPPAPVRSP